MFYAEKKLQEDEVLHEMWHLAAKWHHIKLLPYLLVSLTENFIFSFFFFLTGDMLSIQNVRSKVRG